MFPQSLSLPPLARPVRLPVPQQQAPRRQHPLPSSISFHLSPSINVSEGFTEGVEGDTYNRASEGELYGL